MARRKSIFIVLLLMYEQVLANPALIGGFAQDALTSLSTSTNCRLRYNNPNMSREDKKYWIDRCRMEASAKSPTFTNTQKSEIAQSPAELAGLQFTCNLKGPAFKSKGFLKKCAENGIVPENERRKWEWHKEVVCEPDDPKKCKTVYSNAKE